MKNIKEYKEFEKERTRILELLMKYRLKRFKINSDNSVSFSSNVYLNNLGLSELPFKIRIVKGDL
jgi:hypothetical protein